MFVKILVNFKGCLEEMGIILISIKEDVRKMKVDKYFVGLLRF